MKLQSVFSASLAQVNLNQLRNFQRISSKTVRSLFLFAILLLIPTVAPAATVPSGFTETVVATGLSSATRMAFAPDGRLFVCQQGGALRVIKNGVLLPTPFVTLTVSSSGERGLLGVTFDPNFASNHYVYVYYTATTPATHNRVSRFTANGDVAVAGSESVIIDLNNLSSATNHNGGAIHFGPDGKLYIAVGENANPANAQTLTNLLGKMLRINSDGSIPTDNPFFNTATGINRAIWAWGLRNPYSFSFQRTTGRMFINDVGQSTWEEINDGIAGSNYGWNNCEGFCSPANANFRDPLYEYAHSGGTPTGCSIIGSDFYNPTVAQFPATYVGQYFFGDYCGGFIRVVDPASPSTSVPFVTGISSLVDLAVNNDDGSLYYLTQGGSVVKIQYGFIISEYRTRGLNGANDEFVEFFNNADSSVTVSTADGSSGWALVASDGAMRFVIPNGTVIPSHKHYLAVNNGTNGYSLATYAAGDLTYATEIPDNAGIALFRTSNAANFIIANRLDATGTDAVTNTLYREGNGTHSISGTVASEVQDSYVRKIPNATGLPLDTADNAADFVHVSTNGFAFNGESLELGAPGPENLASPVQRNNNQITASLIEPTSASSLPPNRIRCTTCTSESPSGTLSIRRRFTNNTGATITRLRFRVVDITTLHSPVAVAPQADLRLTNAIDETVSTTTNGTVSLKGALLEAPSISPGGGINSSVAVALPAGGLLAGQTIDVQYTLNLFAGGNFRFFITVEALP
jgi:glucose/arabinose dehydrogenase